MSDSLPQIEKHITNFYKALFGEKHVQQASLYDNFWDNKYLVTEQARLELEKPFTMNELKDAVFGSNASGAPSPDGFTFAFYQHFWELVQDDLILLLTRFYNNSLHVVKINHVMLCLLPKEFETSIIQKFRLISLLDYSYKIISKIFTNKLDHMVHNIVDEEHATFIQGRFILDNVLAAHEIIHFAKTTKQQGIILKIDFEKTYDKVSWSFLKELLISRGFGLVWTNWIEYMLIGAKTYINLNDNLTPYFQCIRGI
jgi:Reverse transcriptase (RNA-dependent DNA polymerase)